MDSTGQHTVQSWMWGNNWLQLFNAHPPSPISVLHEFTASLWKQTTQLQRSGSGRTGFRKHGDTVICYPAASKEAGAVPLSLPIPCLSYFIALFATWWTAWVPLFICVTVSAHREVSGLPYSLLHSWCLGGCCTLSRCLLAMTYWMGKGHFPQMLYFPPMLCPPDSHRSLLSPQFLYWVIISK